MEAVGVTNYVKKAVDNDGYGVYKYLGRTGGQIVVNLGVKTQEGPIPPVIQERRAEKRIKEVAKTNVSLAQRMDELFVDFKTKSRAFIGKCLDGMRKRIADRGPYLAKQPLLGKRLCVPCGPHAKIIGCSGISDEAILRISSRTISEDDRNTEIAQSLTEYWPDVQPFELDGLHHAYRRSPIIHICGGGGIGNAFISDDGAFESAKMALAMRGVDVKKHPFIVIRHSDKPGRSDFHILLGRAGSCGIWGMDSALDGPLDALQQNILTSFAGLDVEHQVNLPWGMSARKLAGSMAVLKNVGRDGKPIAARYYDFDTGTTKNVPLLGDKAIRRWVEVMRGQALAPADAMMIWTKAKNGKSDDPSEAGRTLIDYVLRQGKFAKMSSAAA